MNKKNSLKSLLAEYNSFKEKSLQNRIVKHSNLLDLLNNLYKNKIQQEKIGSSTEGRDIFYLSIGTGKTKILMWTQMHGDEPTATLALFDLLNLFTTQNIFSEQIDKILSAVTLHIIPMLNPDGAEKFTRRNAVGIDINRDAIKLQSPEANILMNLRDELKPDFGFNLHDQDPFYSAGRNNKSALISLLAPPFNFEESINETRENGMKLCAFLFNKLSEVIPGQTAKYDEEFEPRAFGDNFVKKGTSTILIEAGGQNNYHAKEFVRELFFISLFEAIKSIADKSYLTEDINTYKNIPLNKELYYDLILRNILIEYNGKEYKVDIAVNRYPKYDSQNKTIYYEGIIEDIGDLSIYYGHEDLDLTGCRISPGKTELREIDISKIGLEYILEKGISFVKSGQKNKDTLWTNLPVNFFCDLQKVNPRIVIENHANFFLKRKNRNEYAVVNGYLIKAGEQTRFKGNGLISR